jgi:glucosyl-dolichyl phosphate glucuronosyltransferase
VILCTHSLDCYPYLQEAINSVLIQTVQPSELIVVVDGNKDLHTRIATDYIDRSIGKLILLEKNSGISEARNTGIRAATGDILVFMDDDAVAEKDWLEKLASTYQSLKAISVGGKILPSWLAKQPDYFPEELYWLVGVTNTGFSAEKITEVRNTYGANMSFKKEVFQKVGLFSQGFGFTGASYLQAEEPELALRMKKHFGKGVIYNPEAIVHHKIHPSKVGIRILFKRSFFQGYSKALLRRMESGKNPINTERTYLRYLLLKRIPSRICRIGRPTEVKKGSVLIMAVVGVGLGFVYGLWKAKGRH